MDIDNKNQDQQISNQIEEDFMNLKIDSKNNIEPSPIFNILELINSLKEKINIYEEQIKKLIDDKVKLQMDMNAMILENLQSKKKTNDILTDKENSIDINNQNNIEKEQQQETMKILIEINKKLKNQNEEFKKQIDVLKTNIETYKIKISNINNNNNNNTKCMFCEQKKAELAKMAEEKKEIVLAITELRKQLDELKISERLKKSKKKNREKIKKTESLPNIEQYFILNNKFQLVDSDRNLWHMKKCQKFQEFKKSYMNSNISAEDILKEFVDTYESKSEEEKNNKDDEENNHSNENENEKKSESKYLPPLPGHKNKNVNKNTETEGEINSSDIHINIADEKNSNKEENEIKKEENGENVNNSSGNNIMNSTGGNKLAEIKEETSFNLSDNTD